MRTFAAHCFYRDHSNTASLRDQHQQFLKSNCSALHASGALLDGDGRDVGWLLLIEAEDEAGARALLEHDPYHRAQAYAKVELLEVDIQRNELS